MLLLDAAGLATADVVVPLPAAFASQRILGALVVGRENATTLKNVALPTTMVAIVAARNEEGVAAARAIIAGVKATIEITPFSYANVKRLEVKSAFDPPAVDVLQQEMGKSEAQEEQRVEAVLRDFDKMQLDQEKQRIQPEQREARREAELMAVQQEVEHQAVEAGKEIKKNIEDVVYRLELTLGAPLTAPVVWLEPKLKALFLQPEGSYVEAI